ncbi:nucleolar protein 2 [Trichoderma gamsii]|uniref:Nucleolar protein 2 n=1 Tax=Trichoderma gamsii TaxID=398673 RepID=A0A2P5A0U4_9HYPO|nr:nucleolar protein 2 [Trichoderma gamsii]PON30148.1 nucleolar protein 2 [Trichoderma gamsii]
MGQGRRMKRKQGMPEALSEEHFANLKRKAGLPVEPPVEKASLSNKKRKTAKGAAAAKKPEPAPKKSSAKKSNGKAKKLPEPEKDSEDEEMGDEFDLDQLEDDASSDEDASLGEKKKNIWSDEEKDSDDAEEDDSVFDSDDQEDGGKKGKFVFSDDEDESDAEEKLTAANIAGLSRKLDKKLAEDKAITETEMQESAMQTNIDGPKIFGDEDDEDDELADKSKSLLAPDLQLLRQRITDTIRVLDDFANLAEDGRSRAEYTAQLLKDICAYYGYSPYLAEKLFNLFTPREAFAFFEANEMPRPVVIRTNTLRTHRRDLAQALINRGVTLEPVGKWSKVGLQIFEANVPLGATPEYLAGHYIIQAAASFLPVMALSPQPNERVLDMASAPGGKTTYCSAMMNNTGIVFANDPNKERAKGLIGNVARLGVRNVIVCSYDGREFPRVMGGFDRFIRVLLDAPCSGTGVISKDPSVKTNKDEKDFISLPHMQKQLLLSAIDSVNHASETGGFLVYSTCSVTVEENESVVAYALSRRPNVKLVDAGIPFGKEGFTSYMGKKFHPSLKLTRRFYPHAHNIDGFYVAKFQKIGPTAPNAIGAAGKKNGNAAASGDEEVIDKTPITTDEDTEVEDKSTKKKSKGTGNTGTEKSDFSAFDEDEDVKYMEKAKKNAMRRRGLDPKSLKKPKSQEKK